MRRRRFQKSSLQLRQILGRPSFNLSNTTPRSGQFVKYDVQQRTIWNICPSVKLHFLTVLVWGCPAVQHQLIQLAGQSVAPQVLAGLPQSPGRGEAPPTSDLPETCSRAPDVTLDAGSDLLAPQHPLQLLKVLSVHLGAQGQPRPVLPGPRPCAERGQPQYVAARGPGARMSHCHDGYWMST